jgi:hypothetical protein
MGDRYHETGFALDVQAKSTTTPSFTNEHVLYDLEVKNYDHLRDPHPGCPRILVVVVLPAEETRWTEQTEDHLCIRRCGYWMSLKGREPTTNKATIQVLIPRANVFSIENLHLLMGKVERDQEL